MSYYSRFRGDDSHLDEDGESYVLKQVEVTKLFLVTHVDASLAVVERYSFFLQIKFLAQMRTHPCKFCN